VTIIKLTSRDDGGCNGCNKYSHKDGVRLHDVFVVTLKCQVFRLCRECMDEAVVKFQTSLAGKETP
jgi:hypothetical protein